MDISMLAFTGGRERTQVQYAQLLAAAGFELRRSVSTGSGLDILEAG